MRKVVVVLAGTTLLIAGCTGKAPPPHTPSTPPPAVSGLDRTVTVNWQLADSFDVLPDGLCAGRGENAGMGNGARIQLHGNSTGFDDETTVTATLQRRTLGPRQALSDDGVYCVLRAVFAPALPDPDGYVITFPGTRVRWDHLGAPGALPGATPGLGAYDLGFQMCPTLLDPPEKECP